MDITFQIWDIIPGVNASGLNGMEGFLFSQNQTLFYHEFVEVQASRYLYLYVSPWLLFFGTVGNILSYAIMQRMSFRVWSTCLYMSVLPIVDLVILYVECGNNWIIYLSDETLNISQFLMVSSNAVCKVYTFLFNFVLHISPWLVVAMLGECMLSLRFQRHTPRLCTREHTRAVMLLITVLLICVNIQFFWTYGLTKPLGSDPPFMVPLCTYIREWSESYGGTTWPTISTFIGHLLPLVVILGLCLTISLTYVRAVLSPKFRRSHNALSEEMFLHFLDPIAFQEFQGTILTVGFVYIILMPPQLCLIIYRFVLFSYQETVYTLKLDAQLKLLTTVTHILHYLFLSCKFAIYYISSKRFQREFMEIIKALCKPFTACTKHRYSVKKTSVKRGVLKKDEQTVKLVHDGKYHVTCVLEKSMRINSCSQSITTDV